VNADSDYYSDYLARTPHPRSQGAIRRWHARLLTTALRVSGLDADKHHRVLEVGYGHGYFADAVCERGWDYSCADISRPLVDLGTANGHDVRFPESFQSDDAQQFDLVWLSHVLEHATTWDAARSLLVDYLRYLKPGGMIVVVCPDYLSWKRHFWSGDFSHGYPTTRRNVVQLLRDIGLRPISATYHRGGTTKWGMRAVCTALSFLPHVLLDPRFDRERARLGEGFVYSWKTVFGWRQIMVWGRLEDAPAPSVS